MLKYDTVVAILSCSAASFFFWIYLVFKFLVASDTASCYGTMQCRRRIHSNDICLYHDMYSITDDRTRYSFCMCLCCGFQIFCYCIRSFQTVRLRFLYTPDLASILNILLFDCTWYMSTSLPS